MFSLLFSVSSLFFILSHSTNAASVKRGDAKPEITSPNHDSTWISGNKETVTWVTNNITPEDNNSVDVMLGFYGTSDPANPIIWDKSNPLATNVPITSGQVQVIVPAATYYNPSYIIGLFGPDGSPPDTSATFTIVNIGTRPTPEQP